MSTSESPPASSIGPSHLVGQPFAGRFRVLRLVSQGANTAIYDASDDETGRTVTLKLVRPRLAASPSFRSRFDETMRAVAALSHPNIAAIYDWGIARVGDTSTTYVVIEQMTGGSLRDMFDRGRRLSPSQALAVGLDACRGLDYAHRRRFVHSELTPSKLVFGDDRRLRIVDFGLAQLLGESVWEQPDAVPNHTAWYASPEQAQGLPIDGKTDVYALCLSLQEATTGTLPFRDDSTVATLAARIGRLMPVSADLGPLAAVFEHAGRPEHDERSSAAEFGKDLVQAASKLPRPEPLPLLSTGLFDTPADQMRSPSDPTGGVRRPADDASSTGPAPLVVVPVDEPAGDVAADPVAIDPVADGASSAPPAEATDAVAESGVVEVADPGAVEDAADAPEAPTIIEAEPEAVIPVADPDDDLVILPLDSEISAEPTASQVDGAAVDAAPAAAPTQVIPTAVEPTPRRRRGFPWKILLGLMVVGALAVLGVLATRLFETPVYRVPDLVDLPQAEARNLVAANGWVVTIETERNDDVPTVGNVIRTVPQAGVDLAEGEPFLIVVSEGPTLRELPDSAGVPLSEAQTALNELGLDVVTVEQFDEVVPAGTVISWSVPGDPTLDAGSLVLPMTQVELVVSTGPAPRTVPTLVGLPAGEARAAIEDLDLVFTELGQEFSDDVALGVVIAQDTEAGIEVERGAAVGVVVSLGPDLVVFPDISGAANFDEASVLVRQAGFEVELVFGDAQGQVQSYTIDGEQPETGATYRRGTLVRFRAFDPE